MKDYTNDFRFWKRMYYFVMDVQTGCCAGEEEKDMLMNVAMQKIAELEKPVRYECMLCGRDKFTRKSPHNCVGGFRKRKIEWKPIYE